MNIYLTLFIEFFKIGLFSVGGGMATIPFLYDLADKYVWLTPNMISNIVAIAESTPGPIGINAATYAGYNAAGIPGGIIASLSLVLPSLIIVIIIAKGLQKFHTNPYVITVFSGLRPVVTALIAVAGLQIFKIGILNIPLFEATGNPLDILDLKAFLLFAVMFLISLKKNFHPIVYVGVAAAAGIVFKM